MTRTLLLLMLTLLSVVFPVIAESTIIRDYGTVDSNTNVYMTSGAFVFKRDGYFEGTIEVPRSLGGAYLRITVYDDTNESPLDRIELRVTSEDGETFSFTGERRLPMDSNFAVDQVRGHWQLTGSASLPVMELRRLETAESVEIVYQRGSETVVIPIGEAENGEIVRDLSLALNFFRLGK